MILLSALRELSIPDQTDARARKQGYRTWPIERQSDDGPLVDASSFGLHGRNHYAHALNPPYWRRIEGAVDALFMRRTVAEKLQRVNTRLLSVGLRLHLFDAWRPRAVQAFFYDVFMPEQLRQRRPELKGADLRAEVERYWSAPTMDASSPAPHETGAAVDLTVAIAATGEHLYMGSVFDDATAIANLDHFERPAETAWSLSEDEARGNRRVLFHLMRAEGFVGHPDEWWHYSFGDQFWAALTGAPTAQFGVAAPPP